MPDTPEVFLSERSITTFSSGVQDDLQITELDNGRILMSWRSENNSGVGAPSGSDIIGQMFDVLGNRIGDEFRLNTFYTTDDQSSHSVAALDNGGWVVTYQDAGTATSIRVETYNDLGVRTDARSIQNDNNASFPNYANPVIAHSGGSSVLVAFEGVFTAASSNIIYYRAYNPVTESVGAQQVLFTTGGGAFGLDFSSVEMTTLENGNYVAVAQFHNSSIQMRIITPTGTSVLTQTTVAGTATNNSELDINPQVAALTGGGYVVTWQNVGSDTDVYYQVYTETGSAFGSTRIADTGSTNDNTQPQIAALADGGFVLFWNNLDEDALRLQRYDASGLPVGSEVTVVTDADVARVETVEALSDGRFVVGYTGILGEPRFKIYDPRDGVTYGEVRLLDGVNHIIGTKGADVITFDTTPFEAPTLIDSVELFAFDGNDTIDLTDRTDVNLRLVDGGRGTDTLILADMDHLLFNQGIGSQIDLKDGLIQGNGALVPVAVTSIENVTGSLGSDEIRGDALDNHLIGMGGADFMFGREGDDTLWGGLGQDTLTASQGVDVLAGGFDNDVLALTQLGIGSVGIGTSFAGNSGTDTLRIIGGNADTFTVDFDDYIFSSLEKLEYGGVRVDISTDQLLGFETVHSLYGGDSIVASMGSAQDADFSARVFSGDGEITILGNSGNNVITAFETTSDDAGVQYLFGGRGRDTITGSAGADSIGAGGGNDVVYGLGNNDIINGASGHDLLDGGDGHDTIYSGNGNDTLIGGNGSDHLYITSGSATVDGGMGSDIIYFSVDVDELLNNARSYSIDGGPTDNGLNSIDFSGFNAAVKVTMADGAGTMFTDGLAVAGENLDESYFSFTGMSVLLGSEQSDFFNLRDEQGGHPIKIVEGRDGDDTIISGEESRYIKGGNGDDDIDLSAARSAGVRPFAGVEEVSGGWDNDHIVGSSYDDHLTGGDHAPSARLDADIRDNDTIYGGAGSDIIYGDHVSSSTLTFFRNEANSEDFDRTDNPNYLGPRGGDDSLFGGDGSDKIFGDIGDDYIVGGAEVWSGSQFDRDILFGGLGNDTIMGGAQQDLLYGNDGDDSLLGGRGDDTLVGDEGADTMHGGGGYDRVSYFNYLEQDTTGVVVDLQSGTGSAGYAAGDVLNNFEELVGSRFGDEITVGSDDYTILGKGGDDTIIDANGSDTINGEDGDDLIIAHKGQNTFIGGADTDTISYRNASGGVEINLDTNVTGGAWARTDTISGFENAFGSNSGGDTIVGTDGANELRGYRGSDEIHDGAGDDYVSLGKGNDTLYAGRGNDDYNGARGDDLIVFLDEIDVDLAAQTAVNRFGETDMLFDFENVTGSDLDDVIAGDGGGNVLRGLNGADVISGRGGRDLLQGGEKDDVLDGGNSKDTLEGGQGDDTLDGGAGDDLLVGGSGSDHFVFVAKSGNDTVSDFEAGKDILVLSGFGFDEILPFGEQIDNLAYFDFDGEGTLTFLNASVDEIEASVVFES